MKTNDKPRIDGTRLDSKINGDNPHIIPIVKWTKILLKVAEKYFFLYKTLLIAKKNNITNANKINSVQSILLF